LITTAECLHRILQHEIPRVSEFEPYSAVQCFIGQVISPQRLVVQICRAVALKICETVFEARFDQFCCAHEVALIEPFQRYTFRCHIVGAEGNIINGDVEFIQSNGCVGGMEHKLELHIHCGATLEIDHQLFTIQPIELRALWYVSAQVADDQVDCSAFEVSDVANTDHRLITGSWPKSSKVITDDF